MAVNNTDLFGEPVQGNAEPIQLDAESYRYYQRKTQFVLQDGDPILLNIYLAQAKLAELVKKEIPGVDPENNDSINKKIKQLQNQVKKLASSPREQLNVKQQLTILQGLLEIRMLRRINIPGEKSDYYTLYQPLQGVTEKVGLVSLAAVDKQLKHLLGAGIDTVADYHQHSNYYTLTSEAMLKLPKQGNVKEVLREQVALNISRTLGLQTTRSTMVEYQGKPALFVPFDNIRLLKDITTGETMTAVSLSGKKYTDNSTLQAVGEGLSSERFTGDFGRMLPLLYLCSDPDAVGGYCQNKALKDGQLYVFDQVLNSNDILTLDANLNIKPVGFYSHSRHTSFRNKELFNDASLENKYNALVLLQKEQGRLAAHFDELLRRYQGRERSLTREIHHSGNKRHRPELKKELAVVQTLAKEAAVLKEKVEKRIEKIAAVMPKVAEDGDPKVTVNAMKLGQLLDNPRLFTKDGRPYRNPMLTTSSNRVLQVRELPGYQGGNLVEITFAKVPSKEKVAALRQCLPESERALLVTDGKVITLPKETLASLEAMKFPERQTKITAQIDYLDLKNLKAMKTAYGVGNRAKIINAIADYRRVLHDNRDNPQRCLEQMTITENAIKRQIATAKDKGFGFHVLKKFQFDVQQQLQKLMPPEMPKGKITEAFNAALKLDRTSQFNTVVKEALRQDKLKDPAFERFLDACLNNAREAVDHFSAKEMSMKLDEVALSTLKEMAHVNTQTAEVEDDISEDLLADVDPLGAMVNGLSREASVLGAARALASPDEEAIIADSEKPTISVK